MSESEKRYRGPLAAAIRAAIAPRLDMSYRGGYAYRDRNSSLGPRHNSDSLTATEIVNEARTYHVTRNEFFRRLRVELIRQQKGIPELRSAAGRVVELLCTGIETQHNPVTLATVTGTRYDVVGGLWNFNSFEYGSRQRLSRTDRELSALELKRADDAAEWFTNGPRRPFHRYMSDPPFPREGVPSRAPEPYRRDQLYERELEEWKAHYEPNDPDSATWTPRDGGYTYTIRQIAGYFETLTQDTRVHWRFQCPTCPNTVAVNDDNRMNWALGQWVEHTEPYEPHHWRAPIRLLTKRMPARQPPEELRELWEAFGAER